MDYNIKIKSLLIKNFRQFKELQVDFDGKGYVALAGRNGTGKTSILEAIHIALSERSSKFTDIVESDFCNEEPIVLEVEFDKPFFFEFIDQNNNDYRGLVPCWKFRKTIKRRGAKEANQLFSSEYHVMTHYLIEDFRPSQVEFDTIKQTIATLKPANTYLVRNFWNTGLEGYKYHIQTSTDDRQAPVSDKEFDYYLEKLLFPKSFYFDCKRDRELLPQYNTALLDVVNELNWRFKRELTKPANQAKKDVVINSFDSLHEGINDIDSYKKTLLEPALLILKDELHIELDGDLDFYSLNLYKPFSDSIFGMVTEENQFVTATKFGSGISILTALAISISFTQQSKIPFIVLIDEPELHLHADLQKHLYHYLLNSDFQTIVSTHSHLFIDKVTHSNNLIFSKTMENNTPIIASKIDVSDLQFRLLGNSLEDLYIPERLLIVEGKHDRDIIAKCLELLGHSNLDIQIICAGGKSNIPTKTEQYTEVINEVLNANNWYSKYLNKSLKIIVDGDVTIGTVNGWAMTHTFDKATQIFHIDPVDRLEMEHLFPESLVKELVVSTALNDGTMLTDKTAKEIVGIILDDDKKTDKTQCLQTTDRMSKSWLNQYVQEHITAEILNLPEGQNLKDLIEWTVA